MILHLFYCQEEYFAEIPSQHSKVNKLCDRLRIKPSTEQKQLPHVPNSAKTACSIIIGSQVRLPVYFTIKSCL